MNLPTVLVSFVSGSVFTEIVRRLLDFKTGEIEEDRKQKKQSRHDLSLEIMKILNEGSNKDWVKKPADTNHINFIGRQLAIENQAIAQKYNNLVSRWIICAERSSRIRVGAFTYGVGFPPEKEAQFKEIEKHVMELQHELNDLDKEISREIKKWR